MRLNHGVTLRLARIVMCFRDWWQLYDLSPSRFSCAGQGYQNKTWCGGSVTWVSSLSAALFCLRASFCCSATGSGGFGTGGGMDGSTWCGRSLRGPKRPILDSAFLKNFGTVVFYNTESVTLNLELKDYSLLNAEWRVRHSDGPTAHTATGRVRLPCAAASPSPQVSVKSVAMR